jgi:hypothetical protein
MIKARIGGFVGATTAFLLGKYSYLYAYKKDMILILIL